MTKNSTPKQQETADNQIRLIDLLSIDAFSVDQKR
jgi:hypothetical protein